MAVSATTYTWINSSGTVWNTLSAWTPTPGANGPDATTSYALINAPVTGAITFGTLTSISVGSLSITASATLDISSGQTLASGALVASTLAVNAGTVDLTGGILKFNTISAGGGTVFGYGTLTNPAASGTVTAGSGGAIVADVNGGGGSGTLEIVGAANNHLITVTGSYQIDSGAVLDIDTNTTLIAGSVPTINFVGTNGTLDVVSADEGTPFTVTGPGANIDTFNGTIYNMHAGSTGGSATGASSILFDIGSGNTIQAGSTIVAGSTLEVFVNTDTYYFDTNGGLSGDYLNWGATSGTGAVEIWADTNPCYAAGTRVLTERGEVAVEDLAEGDMVVTLSGDTRSLRPVRWIGNRRMNVRQHPQPNLVAPVRVRQHAFGENLPSRDLLLSPDHCLFVDGKLIPAKLLINDRTIVQERDTAAVHYYHVELDRHAVMFAEGLPAESYLDTGNRAMFSNAGLALMLHPDFEVNANLKCWETDACAPLAVSAEIVKPIHDRLADRAGSLGYRRQDVATSTDPELRLVADGRVIRPLSSDANRYVFTLPAGVSSVRLTSRAGVPSYFEAYLDDWRQLGVAVRRIVVRDSAGLVEIPPDHPGLTQGWHKVEHDDATMWRWTNGDAVLPIGPTQAPTLVEVQVGMVMKHVVENVAQDRLAA